MVSMLMFVMFHFDCLLRTTHKIDVNKRYAVSAASILVKILSLCVYKFSEYLPALKEVLDLLLHISLDPFHGPQLFDTCIMEIITIKKLHCCSL